MVFTVVMLFLPLAAHAQEDNPTPADQSEDNTTVTTESIDPNACTYNKTKDNEQYTCQGVKQGEGEDETCEPKNPEDCQKNTDSTTSANDSDTSSSTLVDPNSEDGRPITAKEWDPWAQGQLGVKSIMHEGLCELIGVSPAKACVELAKKPGDKTTSLRFYDQVPGGGLAGNLTAVASALYTNPPTSSVHYLAHMFEDMGLAPKSAYAQVGGSGAGIIKPVEALWKVTRNISYIVFIIVFIAVGFMIMLRRRIDSHTVVSVQQALPGLVIGIILVTFSYFIAALIIDLSFIGIQLAAQIFIQAGGKTVIGDPQDLANNSNVFQMFISSIRLPENFSDITGGIYRTIFSAFGGGAGGTAGTAGVGALIPAVIGGLAGASFPLHIPNAAGTGVVATGARAIPFLSGIGIGGAGAVGAGAIGVGVGLVAPLIISLLVVLILAIALIVQFFRLLWQLISSYISILIATIAGPLVITFASIPGRGGVLSWWWKGLLGNALVFPAVFAAFLFAGMILSQPIETFNAQPPLFGGLSTEFLRLILAYGIILATPSIPGMVKKMMGVQGPEGFAQAAFQGFGGGAAVARTAARGGLGEYGHAVEAYERKRIAGGPAPAYDRADPWLKRAASNAPIRGIAKRLGLVG